MPSLRSSKLTQVTFSEKYLDYLNSVIDVINGDKVLDKILETYQEHFIYTPWKQTFDNKTYLCVEDPRISDDSGVFGLALRCEGDVKVDEAGLLQDGVPIMGVFYIAKDGKKYFEALPEKWCKGMRIGLEDDMRGDIRDINRGIGVIRDLQSQIYMNGGILLINKYFIEYYSRLARNNNISAAKSIKTSIKNNTYETFSSFLKAYNESKTIYSKGDLPIDIVALKLKEMLLLDISMLSKDEINIIREEFVPLLLRRDPDRVLPIIAAQIPEAIIRNDEDLINGIENIIKSNYKNKTQILTNLNSSIKGCIKEYIDKRFGPAAWSEIFKEISDPSDKRSISLYSLIPVIEKKLAK